MRVGGKTYKTTLMLRGIRFLNLAKGVLPFAASRYNEHWIVMRLANPNSHLPACWLHFLVCPRRYRALLPARVRPNLFGSD